jgi:hypothetical protein
MKFSIRDLFLVTVIVALVLGWWLDRSRLSADLLRKQNLHFGTTTIYEGPAIPYAAAVPPTWIIFPSQRMCLSCSNESTSSR